MIGLCIYAHVVSLVGDRVCRPLPCDHGMMIFRSKANESPVTVRTLLGREVSHIMSDCRRDSVKEVESWFGLWEDKIHKNIDEILLEGEFLHSEKQFVGRMQTSESGADLCPL